MAELSEPTEFLPTKQNVELLQVGDSALNCFGEWVEVTRIFARGTNVKGKLFVCFDTKFGENGGQMSGSYTENELVRTVPLTNKHTSADLDVLEQHLRLRQQATQIVASLISAGYVKDV